MLSATEIARYAPATLPPFKMGSHHNEFDLTREQLANLKVHTEKLVREGQFSEQIKFKIPIMVHTRKLNRNSLFLPPDFKPSAEVWKKLCTLEWGRTARPFWQPLAEPGIVICRYRYINYMAQMTYCRFEGTDYLVTNYLRQDHFEYGGALSLIEASEDLLDWARSSAMATT